ncbi:MAG: hypothetical protein I8H98_11020 [Moraxellaceae bacterium]|uniref:Uncharacterized protein n=1 Tax=Acinetobacter tjernbergiae DSM 14971 = CIP 107465 TaxID=1120928 RepID=V2URM4_9GAMM|nr:hypothetical protein [Acinetobacter tjernbergiae]ESK57383.1 hypothetical protein F990_00300 [Acinetobacter tjernbergiae DSM 14971 = CIP 107465]MBH2002778.1 hypothetical protein [Moraxellaceae bacterium]MBH2029287.1 hypothetical protein [Moraxellaceae bacterium]
MSVILNICGMLIATSHFPDATLQEFYQQYYHCQIKRSSTDASTHVQSASAVTQLFPQTSTWWPIFTVDQLQSESFKNLIEHGVKPGIILPNEYFSVLNYYKIKKAVNEGAIPVAVYQMQHSKYFAAKATFSTAIGLRPLAAIIQTGWDENIIAQPAGSYLIQSENSDELNIPARVIQHHQHYFYQATSDISQNTGYQIIVNPPIELSLNNIQYPHFGISWTLNNTDYRSTPDQIETNLFGYLMIAISTVIIPLDYIFSTRYPSLLSTFGSSISWISLLLGCTLLLILIISIIRRRRINARN